VPEVVDEDLPRPKVIRKTYPEDDDRRTGRPRREPEVDDRPRHARRRQRSADERPAREPATPKKRPFGVVALLTLLMLFGYGLSLGLVIPGVVEVTLPGIPAAPPKRTLLELERDEAEESKNAAARDSRLEALRAVEAKLVEELARNAGRES